MAQPFDRLTHLNSKDRSAKHSPVHPRDAASLLVIDRRHTPFKILMGLRHQKSSFMPDVFVFPGGALDYEDIKLAQTVLAKLTSKSLNNSILLGRDSDHLVSYQKQELFTPSSFQGLTRLAGVLDKTPSSLEPIKAETTGETIGETGSETGPEKRAETGSEKRLSCTQRELGAGLLLCALRELYEETGLHLDHSLNAHLVKTGANGSSGSHPFDASLVSLSNLTPLFEEIIYLSRAITPPGLKKRFDTRFFLHDYHGPLGWAGAGDNELVKTAWVSFEEALALKLHPMTRVILEDAKDHLSSSAPFQQATKVPFYQYIDKSFQIGAIEMETPS